MTPHERHIETSIGETTRPPLQSSQGASASIHGSGLKCSFSGAAKYQNQSYGLYNCITAIEELENGTGSGRLIRLFSDASTTGTGPTDFVTATQGLQRWRFGDSVYEFCRAEVLVLRPQNQGEASMIFIGERTIHTIRKEMHALLPPMLKFLRSRHRQRLRRVFRHGASVQYGNFQWPGVRRLVFGM